MSSKSNQSSFFIENKVLKLVHQFVERLGIVHEAIEQLHPRIRVNKMQMIDPKERGIFIRNWWLETKGQGKWNDIWQFYIHGMGCRLVHVNTNERLEWDLGHKHSFDKSWFVIWLNWWLQNYSSDEVAQYIMKNYGTYDSESLRQFTYPILEKLAEQGLLEPYSHGYIALTNESEE